MKKLIISIIATLNITLLQAQIPQKISYQAVIRNSINQLVTSHAVGMRISILQGSASGTAVYSETQTPTTNSNGLITIEIGGGAGFSTINWANGLYFIKTETDPTGGTNYSITGTCQLLSVPFALHSKTAESITGTVNYTEADPVFTNAFTLTSPSNNQLLKYNSSKSKWENWTPDFLSNEVDGSITNEIQTLSLSSNQLTISGTGGNAVTFTNWDTDASNDVTTTGNQTIAGNKTFTGTTSVSTIGVGTATPSQTLDVNGNLRLSGYLFDNLNSSGTASQILYRGTDGVTWQTPTFPKGGGSPGQMAIWNGANSLTSISNISWASSLQVASPTTAGTDDAIFEVKNKDGKVVFGVYQTGVRVYVDDLSTGKGGKGGFAVGGLSGQSKINPIEYFRITPDSARIFFKNNPLKGGKGGFAVGGLSNSSKEVANNFIQLTPKNYLIGNEAGKNITTGLYNSFMGYQAGMANTAGNNNIFIGYKTGTSNLNANENIFIGNESGYKTTTGYGNVYIGNKTGHEGTFGYYNTFIGYESGLNNLSVYNLFIGHRSGFNNTEGANNIFMGDRSGYQNTIGNFNIAIGNYAGYLNQNGGNNTLFGHLAGYGVNSNNNTFIGYASGCDLNNFAKVVTGGSNTILGYNSANSLSSGNGNTVVGNTSGYGLTTGSNNVIIGYDTGHEIGTGSGNVFIGYHAGYYETGNCMLYIDNTTTSSPLIWGDFGNNRLVINGNSTNNANSRTFFVNGTAGGAGAWWNDSDERLKKNITTVSNALNKVLNLRGVNYEWKDTNSLEKGVRMGFIAQEAEKIIPEVVNKEGEFYSMQYAPITALLVEAIKDQQKIIEEQKKTIETISESYAKKFETLEQELERIKVMLNKK